MLFKPTSAVGLSINSFVATASLPPSLLPLPPRRLAMGEGNEERGGNFDDLYAPGSIERIGNSRLGRCSWHRRCWLASFYRLNACFSCGSSEGRRVWRKSRPCADGWNYEVERYELPLFISFFFFSLSLSLSIVEQLERFFCFIFYPSPFFCRFFTYVWRSAKNSEQ